MTRIIKNPDIAVKELLKGNVIALPTETVYGLGANGLDRNALLKIFEVKKRPHFNPLILHVYSTDDFTKYCKNIPDVVYKLAEKFSPGPITFILSKKSIVPDIVTAGLDTVAIRIPSHNLFRIVLKKSGLVVAAPSANLFGRISPTSASDVLKELGGKINYILDGGQSKVGIESTVIGFINGKISILRHGFISEKDINSVTKGSIKIVKPGILSSPNRKMSPGMLKNHYAPSTPLYICDNAGQLSHLIKGAGIINLKKYHSLKSVAFNLFRNIREFDEKGFKILLIEKVKNESIGIAINERIEKASSGRALIRNNKPVLIPK